jgi:ribosomal protein S18 acetylase RimI-like enzyme
MELNHLHHEAVPAVFRAPDEIVGAADEWHDYLAKPNAACFVAESERSVVGYCSVEVIDEAHPLAQPHRYARLGVICVMPAFRRQGIAKSLLDTAEAWSRQRGATEMRLFVWKFNQPAAALYESTGFATRSFTMSKALDALDKV